MAPVGTDELSALTEVVNAAAVTATGAVAPLGVTVNPLPAVPPALSVATAWAADGAVTLKCNDSEPPAGTLNEPDHVKVWPLTLGFDVVAPVVLPDV